MLINMSFIVMTSCKKKIGLKFRQQVKKKMFAVFKAPPVDEVTNRYKHLVIYIKGP